MKSGGGRFALSLSEVTCNVPTASNILRHKVHDQQDMDSHIVFFGVVVFFAIDGKQNVCVSDVVG